MTTSAAPTVKEHELMPGNRLGQGLLADEITKLVHGETAVIESRLAAEALFGTKDLTVNMFEALRGVVQETPIGREVLSSDEGLIEALSLSGLVGSKGEGRRLLKQGGVSLNREKISSSIIDESKIIGGKYLLLQKGKKQRNILIITE